MTFADLLCEMIAVQGDLALSEACRVLERYRDEFPSLQCLTMALNPDERPLLFDFYSVKKHTRHRFLRSILI